MKLKAFYRGFVEEDLGNDNYSIWFQDPITKIEYTGEINKSQIEPASERQYLSTGAYFRIAIRRKLTFKFHKKKLSKGAINRAFRKAKTLIKDSGL